MPAPLQRLGAGATGLRSVYLGVSAIHWAAGGRLRPPEGPTQLTTVRIGVDAYNLAIPRGSGIATYARNLCGAVQRLGYEPSVLFGPPVDVTADPLLDEVRLFDAPHRPSTLRTSREAVRRVFNLAGPRIRTARHVPLSGAVIRRQVEHRVPQGCLVWSSRDIFNVANIAYSAVGKFTRLKFDGAASHAPKLMHWTFPLPLRAVGRPNIYTIHDLAPLRLPFATLDNKTRFLSLCRKIAAEADQIVTVSERSANDIVTLLGVERRRIAVTYQCADLQPHLQQYEEVDCQKRVEGIFGLDWKGYFLFFGAIEPKKNLPRIVEAYLSSHVSAPLVIIGGRAWLEDDELKLMYPDIVEAWLARDSRIRRSDRVRLYDYLPHTLLVSLIRGARATLLPSLYEGFGLPVLESMQLGTPVVTSTEGSLPEVAGDAAILVDPYSSHAIERAIRALDADEGLRSELSSRGLRQAAKFSPEAYAERLAELYQPFV